jgi:hypothetical protein
MAMADTQIARELLLEARIEHLDLSTMRELAGHAAILRFGATQNIGPNSRRRWHKENTGQRASR